MDRSSDRNISDTAWPTINVSQESSVGILRITSNTRNIITRVKERRHKVKYKKRAQHIAPILPPGEIESTQPPRNRVTHQSSDQEESSPHPNRIRT